MRFILLYVTLAACAITTASAQEINRDSAMTEALKLKNTFDITFGGSGLAISANYRRKVMVRPFFYLAASAGAGTVPLSGGVTLPHQLSINLGRRNSFFELGLAGTYWTGTTNRSGYSERIYSYQFSPLVGYNRLFFNKLVIRAYANPLFYISGEFYLEDYRFIPYAGMSIGHSF